MERKEDMAINHNKLLQNIFVEIIIFVDKLIKWQILI